MRFDGLLRILPLAFLTILLAAPASGAAPHLVIEVATGKVLSKEDALDRWYPASLTKLMTVYATFQEVKRGRISLQSPVKVSRHALSQPPSKMGLPVDTVMTVDTAIKILMVKSANDIAVALAESVAGTEPDFIALMNGHAVRLGMRDTHFVNPHGLHDPRQYTSARDLAVLTLAIKREFPTYAGYFNIPALRHGKVVLRNHNPLLQRFDGTTGMKTGFVCASGLNIVASAKRSGRELIAVVLGGPTGKERNVRAARLLTDAFHKPSIFVTEKLDRMQGVHKQPVDMRAQVCGPKKKRVAEREKKESSTKAAAAFAMPEPSLEEMEARYLKPAGNNTRVVSIAMGNATGPDPFGLIEPSATDAPQTALAFQEAENIQSAPWPVVPGSRARVPVPEARPRR